MYGVRTTRLPGGLGRDRGIKASIVLITYHIQYVVICWLGLTTVGMQCLVLTGSVALKDERPIGKILIRYIPIRAREIFHESID